MDVGGSLTLTPLADRKQVPLVHLHQLPVSSQKFSLCNIFTLADDHGAFHTINI